MEACIAIPFRNVRDAKVLESEAVDAAEQSARPSPAEFCATEEVPGASMAWHRARRSPQSMFQGLNPALILHSVCKAAAIVLSWQPLRC